MSDNNKRIIVIEGFDGCGKTTQAKMLANHLRDFKTAKFPVYSNETGKIVKRYLNGEFDKYRNSECMITDKEFAYFASSLYTMNRNEYFLSGEYDKDSSYIFDRYVGSNILYNSMLLKEKPLIDEYIKYSEMLEYDVLGFPRASSTYFLSIPIDVTIQNIETRNTTNDKYEQIEYLKRLYEIKDYIIDKLGWSVINCVDDNGDMLDQMKINAEILCKEFIH